MAYTTNPKAPKLRMEAVKLVRKGWSMRKVARYMGYNVSTISRWVKKAPEDGRSVIPTLSSRPNFHPKTTSPEIVDAIIKKRVECRRCSEVVHQLLLRDGLSISLSTVKRTLGQTGLIKRKSKWKQYKQNPQRPPALQAGDLIQIDTIHLLYKDTRYYIFTVLDVHSRWAYARFSHKCNTHEAWQTIREAQKNAPFSFKTIQSDNGPEFSRWFSDMVNSRNIAHRHSRVRKPNDNAHLERFNRTIQEECINLLGWQPSPDSIINALPNYIYFYNHERPHLALNFLSPIKVLQSY